MTPPGIIGSTNGPDGTGPTRPIFEPVGVRVYRQPYAVVDITGPTEAAVLWQASEWLEHFNGSVVVMATTWKGDQIPEEPDRSQYLLELTVDMSIATHDGHWPADWFTHPR
jgi:hypothetical protein